MSTILHVTEDHSIHNTGITSAVDALARQLAASYNQKILTTGPEAVDAPPGTELLLLSSAGARRAWRMAEGQGDTLRACVDQTGVTHLHGLWMWPQWAAARAARQLGKPFIVTPHGMLEPWIWQRQSWPHRLKKTLYWYLLAYPAFRNAALIHALTPIEANTLRRYFPGQRLVTIPHGIDLESIDQILAGLPPVITTEAPYFLFMGRLHPVKAIHLLIEAFAQLPQGEFVLKIAGPTQEREAAYATYLTRLVADLGLTERVQFLGHTGGAAKWQLYRHARAFILPSFSEGMAMVNLEAAACATPVLTTHTSSERHTWERYGGMLIKPQVEALVAGLVEASHWSTEERERRGSLLRQLVEKEYAWQAVLPQWVKVYDQLIKS